MRISWRSRNVIWAGCWSSPTFPPSPLMRGWRTVNGRYFAKWEEDRSCERLGLAPDLFSAIPAQFGYSLERPYVVSPPDDGPLRQGRLEALA